MISSNAVYSLLNPQPLFLICSIFFGIVCNISIFQNLEKYIELFPTLVISLLGVIIFVKTSEWKEISLHNYSIFYKICIILYTLINVIIILMGPEYYPLSIILSSFNLCFIICSAIFYTPRKQPIY